MYKIKNRLASLISNFKFYKNDQGFSLLELAIVLSIFGIIAGMSAPLLYHRSVASKIEISKNHHEQIMIALASFVLRYSRLPCPCLSPQDEGIAPLTCDHVSGAYGLVPYATLGLPSSLGLDGFKTPIRYAVDPSLGGSINTRRSQMMRFDIKENYCVPKGNALHVQDAAGKSIKLGADFFIAVILESGEDTAVKTENQILFRTILLSGENKKHILSWVTRDHLIAYYGKNPCWSFSDEGT